MRPLMEILEDERLLMLKLDSVYQNILRYPNEETYELLDAKRAVIRRDLVRVRNEIRGYFEELFREGDSDA